MTVIVSIENNRKFSCILITIIIVLSGLASVNLVEQVEAAPTGNLSINNSSPTQDSYIPAYSATTFQVSIENHDSTFSNNRLIDWYVCLGVKVSNSCVASNIDSGEININPIPPGANQSFVSQDLFYPNGLNETLTVVYQFDQFDSNPSDDILVFQINASLQYSDVALDYQENIIDNIPSSVSKDGLIFINNNSNYTIPFSGFANLCGQCNINASIGWQLWDHNKSTILKESYRNDNLFPKFSFYKSFTTNLPNLSYPVDGNYILVYGIFNSTGNPFNDMVSENNLNTANLLINSQMNLEIKNLNPSHNPSAQTYFYGEKMATVTIANNGNTTAHMVEVEFKITKTGSDTESQNCIIGTIAPAQELSCLFDVTMSGESVSFETLIPTYINDNQDISPFDNSLQEDAEVIVPQLSSSIIIVDEKEWFTDSENVTVKAQYNPYAATPINISWWYAGVINIGYGDNLHIETSQYGLGSHNFKMIASDSFGNSETIYFNILVYREVSISNTPYYDASAITSIDTMEIIHLSQLPEMFESYNVGNGKSPLLLINLDLIDTATNQSAFDGQNWLEINLNLAELIPDNVNQDSVDFRSLDSFADRNWDYINSELITYPSMNTVNIKIFENTTLLLIGTMDDPNIEAHNFSQAQIANGNFELSWDVDGDAENDYILGWNIYQKLVPEFGGTIFPSPYEDYDNLLWDDLTSNTFRQFVTLEQTSWVDLQEIPEGFCASYAIVPVDRKGVSYFSLANVSMDSTGNSTFVCGDSTPPATSIMELDHEWNFTNDTDCFNTLKDWSICYQITLSWIWPEGENNETWNLYRIEQNPNGIDLSLINPILSDISYDSGEEFSYTENGMDDEQIRPQKTFYYILTPIDEVGNERTVAIYPSENVERVHIQDDWWKYNQHIIPEPEPEPEPPLGNDWLGDFSDNLEQQEFKIAASVTIVILCFGIIMLALIVKRLKRLRKVIGARKRRQAAESMANEFDDFFE